MVVRRLNYLQLIVLSSLLLLLVQNNNDVGVLAAKKKKNKKKTTRSYQYDTSNYVNICPGHIVRGKTEHKTLQYLLQTSGGTTLKNHESAQHKAACFILTKDRKKTNNYKHLSQRYALTVLYYMTDGDNKWYDHTNWLNVHKSECSWMGIICNAFGTIVGMDLGFNNLTGLFPRELSSLTALKDVDLHGNEIQGVIPNSVLDAWTNVVYLRLHMNSMFGQLPNEIGTMQSLKELHIFGNYFQGSIPTALMKLSKLEAFDAYANNFAGSIPDIFGNLKNLRELDLHDNDLTGSMPRSLGMRKMDLLACDCWGQRPEVKCDFCTVCCEGLPNMRCVDMKTKREIVYAL